MARTAGRSAEDTRRLILETAARLIGRHGTAVPVSEIAQEAGVSKGGLLYHFATKEALLQALAEHLIEQFRTDVHSRAEQEDPGPGRLLRAYIRVSLAEAGDLARLRDSIALAAKLMFEPDLERLAQQDADRWKEELLQDGLEPSIVRLVVAAADGSSSAPLWGAILDEEDRLALEEQLLALASPQPGGPSGL